MKNYNMKRLLLLVIALCAGVATYAQTSSEDWVLRAEKIDKNNYYGVTSANGVVGIISSPDPFSAKEVVLAGVYDHFGRGRVNNFLPNINPLNLAITLNGERVCRKNVENYTQTLDMRTGEFVGSLEHKGTKVVYRYCALRHLSHVVLMEVEITPAADILLDARLAHKVPQSLHGAVMTTNDLIFKRKTEPPFKVITTTALSPTENVKMASSSFFLFEEEDIAHPVYHQTPDNDYHSLWFKKQLTAGKTFRFQVIGSLISTAQTADPLNQAERLVTYARFQKKGELLRKHREAWAKLWESDIVIEGDLQAQKEVRSMLYHLYSFSRAGVAHSPSPMGLSGLGYNGHVFWDTEIFMMPPLMILQPDMARSMLEYRYKLLDEARRVGAIVYYDVNFRRNHAGEAIKLASTVIENLEYADIVRGSDEDFEVLYRIGEGDRVFREKVEFYCPRLIYSRGAQGVELHSRTLTKHYAIDPVTPVSTIGAGDNLNAGILYGLIKYRIRRDDLDHLTEHDWDQIIRCGLAFSAETCLSADNYISREFAQQVQRG